MKNQLPHQANLLSRLAAFALVNALLVVTAMGALPTISVNFEGGNAAGAPTILDPGDTAGVVPLANWNNILGENVSNVILNDNSGTPTTVTLSFAADESWGSGTGTGSPDRKLFNGYLGISNDGHYRPLFLNNVPNGAYKLLIYNIRDGQDNQAYTINNDNVNALHIRYQGPGDYTDTFVRGVNTNPNTPDLCNYVQFDQVAPINGTITVDCRSEAFRGIMNGLQLVPLAPGVFRFVNQPQDVTSDTYQNVSFLGTTIDGTGAVTYQWYTNGVADTANGLTNTYTRSVVPGDNGRTFQLVATDSTALSVTSRVATLTLTPLHFVTQPANQTVTGGGSATFSASAASGTTPYTYQWFTNGVADTGGTGNGSSYSRTGIAANENGRTFYVVITDAALTAITSGTATLTVIDGNGKVNVNFLGRGDCAPGCSTLTTTTAAGLINQLNWNNIDNSGVFDGTTGPLNDGNGVATPFTLTYAANDAWNNDGASGTGNEKLFKGISKANGANRQNIYTFNNLKQRLYDVIVFLNVNGDNRRGDISIGSTTFYYTSQHSFGGTFIRVLNTAPAGPYDTGNYARWDSVVPNSVGGIPISLINRGEADGVGIAGFQLVQASVPILVSASSRGNPNGVRVFFGADVGPSGLNPANYTLNNGVTVTGAAYVGNNSNLVQLTVSTLTFNTTYTLTVSNVVDQGGNPIPTPSTAIFLHGGEFNAPQGLTVKRYDGGTDLNGLRGKINACVTPNFTDVNVGSTEYLPNLDNYGTWIYGVYVPPITGNYRFGLAADDNAQLWLSTDSSPANRVLLTSQSVWNNAREYTPAGPQGDGRSIPPQSALVPLVAGRRYYMEILHQEGGGGDHVSVTVQKPGDPAIVNGQASISRNFFATNYSIGCPPSVYFTAPGPVVQTIAPASQTVIELSPTTFTVGVDGTPPYSYQWYSNSVPIPGATGSSYSFSPLRYASNAQYYAVFANEFSSATSSVATLSVISDEIRPTLVRVEGGISRTTVSVVFSEPMTLLGATNRNNYSISNSAGVNLPLSASVLPVLSPDGKSVKLTTDPQTAGQQYFVVVSNVRDRAGVPNLINPNPSVASFIATDLDGINGQVLFRAYPTGGGNTIGLLTGHPSYPNSPDFSALINGMNSRLAPAPYNNNAREGYGGTIVGHFIPPTSGNWIFYVSADDDGQLLMNTNGPNSSGAVIVRFAPGCCRALAAGADPTPPLNLLAGQAYYIEAQFKEGTGGDYVEIGARLQGDASTIVPIGGTNLGFFSKLSISQNPANVTKEVGQIATFNVVAAVGGAGAGSQRYQWQRSTDTTGTTFTNLPGATNASFSLPVFLPDDQFQFRAIVSTPALQTNISTAAILTVVPDVTGPTLVGLRTDGGFRTIYLTYSEPVDPGTAGESSNYILYDPDLTYKPQVGSVEYFGSNVVLHLVDPDNSQPMSMLQNTVYTLEIDVQQDLAMPANSSVPSPIFADFQTWVISCGFVRFDAYFNLTVPNNNDVTPLVNAIAAGTPPSLTFYTNKVNWPQPVPDINNYGMRFTGLFLAPETGSYKFDPSHDDAVRLTISGDTSTTNIIGVFNENCCNEFASGDGGLTVNLTAGNLYWFELLVIEAGGGDYAGLSVILPSGTFVAPIPAQYLVSIVDPLVATNNNAGIAVQPQDQVIEEGATATFSVTVTNTGTAGSVVQWQKLAGSVFVDIAGAFGTTYTTPFLPMSEDGAVYRAAVCMPGRTLYSSNAMVDITADTTPPVALSARALRPTQVEVKFNEAMSSVTAAQPSNFQVSSPGGSIPVVASELSPTDPSRILLALGAPLPCEAITITMSGLQDTATTPNTIVAGSVVSFLNLGLQHRYTFNNPAGLAIDALVPDIQGGAHGFVRGAGATFTGTRVTLPGGSSFTQGYVDLPNGLLSTNSVNNGGSGQVSFEGWTKVTGIQNWSRILDIGNSTVGENPGPAGRGDGADYLFYSAAEGANQNRHVVVVREVDARPDSSTLNVENSIGFDTVFNTDIHFVINWDEATGIVTVYENGVLKGSFGSAAPFSKIYDVNVWLGRSQWQGDANMQGEFDEFRIYNRTLSSTEIAFGAAAGPNEYIGAPLSVELVVPSTTVYESEFQQGTVLADYASLSNFNITALSCYTIISSDPSVVTVTPNGGLQADNPGTADVYVTFAGMTSSVVTITVLQDVIKPTVLSVEGVRTFNAVQVKFSERVDAGSATEPSNYILTEGATPITINSAVLSADERTVTLNIPTHAPGVVYTLNVSGVSDLAQAANTMDPTNFTFKTWVLSCGFVKFEAYLNLVVPDYQNPAPVINAINSGVAPSFSFYTNNANWPQSVPDMNNYGMRIYGLFRAPVSGSYKFEPAHDDSGNLLFSTDASESNAVLVMDFDCCDGFGPGEPGYTVNLVGGSNYWFDLRVIEAGGGDYAGLAVTLPDNTYLAPIPAPYLSVPVPPSGSLQITKQPSNAVVNIATSGTGGSLFYSETFNVIDGGWVGTTNQPGDGPWVYDNASGSWKTVGQGPDNGHANTVLLTSPNIPVVSAGSVRLSFNHRYSFEGGGWDGGQVRVSVNGGAFYRVPNVSFDQNGYNGTVLAGSGSDLAGQAAFVEESAGHDVGTMITSTADLGSFVAGDVVRVQFMAASDSNTAGDAPVWEIDSVSITEGAQPLVATFRVNTTATNLQDGANPPRFFQWYRNNGAGFTPITGANYGSYALAPCSSDNGAQFRVDVCIVGDNVVTSQSATLTVNGSVTVGASASPTEISAGESSMLSATTSARSPSYLWSPGGQTTANVNVSPTVTTVYTVVVTDGITHCTYATNVTVYVATQIANAAPITINDSSPGSPYPSTINVSGISVLVSKVTVTLNNLSHPWPDDIEALLVGPSGQTVHLMSDAGGGNAISGVVLTFADAAAGQLPDESLITSGTYLPSNFGTRPDVFPPPAPSGPWGSAMSVFNGTNPNGTWSLYMLDDEAGDAGLLAGGWSLSIWGSIPFGDVAITMGDVPDPLTLGNNLIYNIKVTNNGPATVANVNVQDVLPGGVTFVSASASQGSAVNNSGTVNASLGSIAAGGSATVTIVVTPTTVGTVNNTATVTTTTTELIFVNNSASGSTTILNAPAQPAISVNFVGCCNDGPTPAPSYLLPTDEAGVVPLPNWNNLAGNNVHDAVLNDSNGTPTTVTIYYDADEQWGNPTAGTNTPNRRMISGYLGISNDGHYRPLFFHNVPNAAYKLIMYNGRGDAQNQGYTVNAGSGLPTLHITPESAFTDVFIRGTSTNPNARDVCNYVQFDEVSPINGTITIDCRSEDFRGMMNGIQLIPLAPGQFRFVNQPQDATRDEEGSVTFYGNAVDGTAPIAYQWLTNGVADTVNGLTSTYSRSNLAANENGRTFQLVATDAGSQSVTSRLATLIVNKVSRIVSATSAGQADKVFVRFSKEVALTGTYTLDNGITVFSAAYGATHRDVVLTTSTLVEGLLTLTATGETREDDGSPMVPEPAVATFYHGFGRYCTDFASLPAGSALFNNGIPNSGYLGDDGTGTNMVVHLTDDGNNGAYGKLFISPTTGGSLLKVLNARWRTRIGGPLGAHADGMSFNWANDLAANGNFVDTEEGEGSGVSFVIDTWDGGSGPDTGLEIQWQNSRIAFLHIPRTSEGNDNFICKDVFVDTSASINEAGLATFTYNGNTISATIPGWAGLANAPFVFSARTGGENDNFWIDDVCINNITPGPVFFIVEPVETTALEGLPATFTAVVDGAPRADFTSSQLYFYQWFSNGVPILGANGSSYSTPPAFGSAEGTLYSVTASNDFSSVTSSNAELHVEIGPRVLAVVNEQVDEVRIYWTRPVELGSGNYTFSGGIFENNRTYGATHNEIIITTDPLTQNTTYTLTIDSVTEEGVPTNVQFPDPTVTTFRNGFGSICTDFAALPPGASVAGSAALSGGIMHITDAVNGQAGSFFLADQNSGFPIDRLAITFKTQLGGGTCCGARYADGMSFNFASDVVPGALFSEEGGGSGLTIRFDTWDNATTDTAPSIEVAYKGILVGMQAMAGIRDLDRPAAGPFIFDGGGNPLSLDTSNQFVNVRIDVSPTGLFTMYWKDILIFSNIQLPNYTPFVGANLNVSARTGGANANHWIDDLCINNFTIGDIFFTQEPVDTTVPEFTSATFTAAVDGTPPYSFQWYTNGVPVSGANNASYTTPPLSGAAEGMLVSVVASNQFNAVTSSNATVHILINPRIVSALSLKDNEVHVVWTRPVDLGSGNYEFTGGIFENNRLYGSNHQEIIIITDPLTGGTTYTMTVSDATEEGNPGNVQSPNPTVRQFRHGYGAACADFAGNMLPPGAVLQGQAYLANEFLHINDGGAAGGAGAFFLPDQNGGFPLDRFLIKFRTQIGGPNASARGADGVSVNFGSDITAATLGGEEGYGGQGLTISFDTWDNNGADTAPAIEIKYKNITVATQAMAGIREGNRAQPLPFLFDAGGNPLSLDTSNTFANVLLTLTPSGKMDVYFKDYLIFKDVQLPNFTPFVNANLNISGRVGGANENHWFDDICINDFSLGNVVITDQPDNATVNENPPGRAHFVVAVDGLPPYTAQWYSNGVPVPGATALSYVTPPLNRFAQGAGYYAIVGNAYNSVTSQTAVVTINQDLAAPAIVSAEANCTSNVYVLFNESVNAATANNPANYTINGGVTVTGASLYGNGANTLVVLTYSGIIPDGSTTNVLTVNGVQDTGPFPNAAVNAQKVISSKVPIVATTVGADTLIVFEAEDYDVNRSRGIQTPNSSWIIASTLSGYVGSGYVDAAPNAGAGGGDAPATFTNATELNYCINFPVAGTYYLWARGSTANDGGNNSFHFGIDGVSPDEFTRRVGNRINNWGTNPANVNAFGWVNDVNGTGVTSVARIAIATPGIHTFNVWMREDGIRLDRFLLTTNAAFTLNNDVSQPGPPAAQRGVNTPVSLTITRNGDGSVTITWPGSGWVLQAADALNPNPSLTQWQDLPYTSPLVIPPGFFGTGNTNVFFRLRSP